MRRFALVLSVLATGILVPTAAGQQVEFFANVVSWTPNVVHPREPVSVVLTLRALPMQGAEIPADGRRDVAVVIRGDGQTRRFQTTRLGSGRYRAKIVFPEAGAWYLRVQYRLGPDGAVGETTLGKGGACVGDCVGAEVQAMRGSPSTGDARLLIGVAIAGAVILVAAVVADASRRRGMVFRGRRATAAEQASAPLRPPDL
jgi:uncharacterized membrane protein YeaQ/YmgE (transglycosylase-associated protein family)